MLRGKIAYHLGTAALLVIVIAGFFAFYLPRASKPCVVENCHGLEIECGTREPDACTEIYEIGDVCRQYASCERVANSCRPVEDSDFDTCKSCVEGCIADFGGNESEVLLCESGCASYMRDYWSSDCPEGQYATYVEANGTMRMLGCEPPRSCSANSDCKYLTIGSLPPRNGACSSGTCKAYCGSGILREC
jgi:hypothetical protein